LAKKACYLKPKPPSFQRRERVKMSSERLNGEPVVVVAKAEGAVEEPPSVSESQDTGTDAEAASTRRKVIEWKTLVESSKAFIDEVCEI